MKRLAAVVASGVDGTSDAAHFIREEAAPLAHISKHIDDSHVDGPTEQPIDLDDLV